VAGPITLITDSSACIPAEAVRRLGVRVVPIQVTIEDQEFRDGVDLEPATLYEALERGRAVKSAAPTPLEYLDAIERAEGSVVVLTPATEFTHMHRNALLAADMCERAVTVVDSRSATSGHGLVALTAAEVAAAGGSVDDVIAAAEDAGARAELVACLESLEFLRQSGHVPAIAIGLAGRLRVRPVFRMREGTAERIGLPRSEHGALDRIVAAWRAVAGAGAARPAVFHAGRPERAAELSRMLGGASFVTEFSAAMAIHTGPGVVGAAWLRAPADDLVPEG
jgi:DegV family protein with EDD domain